MVKKFFFLFLFVLILFTTSCSNDYLGDKDKDNDLIEFLKDESINELKEVKELVITNLDNDALKNNIVDIYDEYLNKIKKTVLVSEISKLNNSYIKKIYDQVPNANSESNLSNLNEENKKIILNLLDKYLYRTNLIGIPLTRSFSLNLNHTSFETWKYFFGEDGIKLKTPKKEYWDVKPILANKYFIKGLNLCIDKNLFKDFSNLNFENLIDFSKYDYYNYDLVKAKKYFKLAITELIENKIYNPTPGHPIILDIEIAYGQFTAANQCEKIHNIIKKSVEEAFNDEEVSDGNFKLNVSSWVGDYFGQIYTDKLYVGKFDISFDKISGGEIDFNEYKEYRLLSSSSEISNDLTTNWSIDTSSTDRDCLIFQGYKYSYDEVLLALNKTK